MNPCSSVLLTDLYQLTMVQAYLEQGMEDEAVFEFFVRRLPAQRGFLMAAGLEQVLDFLARVMTGFCPAILVRSATALSMTFLSATASETPMFRVILVRRGTCIGDL